MNRIVLTLPALMVALALPSGAVAHSTPPAVAPQVHAAKAVASGVYHGKVVSSTSAGLQLRLSNGKALDFTSGQAAGARVIAAFAKPKKGTVAISAAALRAGEHVTVTKTAAHLTIELTGAREQQFSGELGSTAADAFTVTPAKGGAKRFVMNAYGVSSLGLADCQIATVTYHQHAKTLVADNARVTGVSHAGACKFIGETQTVSGVITHVDSAGVTVDLGAGNGSLTASADANVTSGFSAGDLVDVVFSESVHKTYAATDISYVSQTATGTVTALAGDGSSVTIDENSTGQAETFAVDPALNQLGNVSLRDQLAITYHTAAGQPVVDSVADNGTTDLTTSGVVTALTSTSVTVIDDNTHANETFKVSPGMLSGVSIGDDIAVLYYVDGSHLTADNVSNNGVRQ